MDASLGYFWAISVGTASAADHVKDKAGHTVLFLNSWEKMPYFCNFTLLNSLCANFHFGKTPVIS